MALVPIRIDRTSKPPLGTPLRSDGHWSVQGLVGAWAFNEGAGSTLLDSASGKRGIIANGVYVPSGVDFTAAGVYAEASNDALYNLSGNMSIICGITLTASSGVQQFVLSKDDYDKRIIVDNSYGDFLVKTQFGTLLNSGYIGGGSRTGVHLHISYTGSSSGQNIYLGNRIIASDANTNGTTVSSRKFTWGRGTDGSELPSTLISEYTLLYKLALPAQQIAALSANPWQIYEPEVVWIEVPDGAGGTAYTDTLTALAESYASVTDVATYVDAATALITAGVDATSTVTMAEALLASAQAADTVSDAMQRIESVLSVIQAADVVADAVAAVEALLTTVTESGSVTDSVSSANGENVTSTADAVITVADVQAMGEQILSAANVATTTTDAVSAGEPVTTDATTVATVQDVVVMLEHVYTTLEAVATVTDEHTSGVAENLLASAEAIASVSDLQLMAESVTTLAIGGASIAEISIYLESVVSAAVGGASVTDIVAGPLHRIYALMVSVRDPLALGISVRNPLALGISVRNPLALNIAVSPW